MRGMGLITRIDSAPFADGYSMSFGSACAEVHGRLQLRYAQYLLRRGLGIIIKTSIWNPI